MSEKGPESPVCHESVHSYQYLYNDSMYEGEHEEGKDADSALLEELLKELKLGDSNRNVFLESLGQLHKELKNEK